MRSVKGLSGLFSFDFTEATMGFSLSSSAARTGRSDSMPTSPSVRTTTPKPCRVIMCFSVNEWLWPARGELRPQHELAGGLSYGHPHAQEPTAARVLRQGQLS